MFRVLFVLPLLLTLEAKEIYPIEEASKLHEGIPQGKLTKHQFQDSKVFPGTTRDYWVYVPEQYDPQLEACLMIFQDGGAYVRKAGKPGHVPTLFDNLIEAGDMPVTIGLFINPGVVPAVDEQSLPRFNRSYEYDGMGPAYSNFLLDEMIPLLESEHQLKISSDPDDRAIGGASSGAIAAFTAAWERPDQFRRVHSMIGTYVGLRGGDRYPNLIRKTEPKPLRIYLQDGEADNNIYGGDWWMANQTMQRALEFSGYEHIFRWGKGGHSREHGNAVMAEAMRWLWKDHGEVRVRSHPERSKSRASEWLIPGEDWQLVSEGHSWAEGLAISGDGTLYFTDVMDSELYRISPSGEQTLLADQTGHANGIALGAGGKELYTASREEKEIRKYDLESGEYVVVAEGTSSNDVVVSHDGHLYYTDPEGSSVWHVDLSTGERKPVGKRFLWPNGIGLSTDQTKLFVCHFEGPYVHSYVRNKDGSVRDRQPFFFAQAPTNAAGYALDGQCSTSTGELLVGTEAGLQIFDQAGRVQLVLPKPDVDDGRINYCRMHNDVLYIATRERIYKRRLKLKGAPSWKPPVKPPLPRL